MDQKLREFETRTEGLEKELRESLESDKENARRVARFKEEGKMAAEKLQKLDADLDAAQELFRPFVQLSCSDTACSNPSPSRTVQDQLRDIGFKFEELKEKHDDESRAHMRTTEQLDEACIMQTRTHTHTHTSPTHAIAGAVCCLIRNSDSDGETKEPCAAEVRASGEQAEGHSQRAQEGA